MDQYATHSILAQTKIQNYTEPKSKTVIGTKTVTEIKIIQNYPGFKTVGTKTITWTKM